MNVGRFAVGLLVLALAGCAVAPSAPGKLIDVDGRKVHLDCTGVESQSPTFVIVGGMSGVSTFYTRLQQGLGKSTRVCTYDRAGLGWSDPIDGIRDAHQMAIELHALLRAANIPPPYVLAGHSLGGLAVLSYQHSHASEVAGLVLLDSSYPGQKWDETSVLKTYRLARVAAALGITRFYNPTRTWYADLPEREREALLYFSNQPSIYKATMGEIRGFNASSTQTAEIKSVGDIPLLVVTAGDRCSAIDDSKKDFKARCETAANNWTEQHAKIARLSSRGHHVTFPAATHYTLITNEAIASQVVNLIAKDVLVD